MVKGIDFTIDIKLSDTSGDKLRILRSEIQDHYFFLHVGIN